MRLLRAVFEVLVQVQEFNFDTRQSQSKAIYNTIIHYLHTITDKDKLLAFCLCLHTLHCLVLI